MKYPLSEKQIFHFRPKPFFFITTNKREELTYEALYASLERMKKAGFGGIVLFNKPQGGFNESNYLGEDFFYMVKNAAQACKDLGLEMWINDAYDYPPGAVAGKVEKIAPHLKMHYIHLKDGKPTVEEADWGFPAFEEPLSGELFRKLVYEEYRKQVGEYFGDPIKGFFSDTDNRRILYTAMYDENSPMRDYFPWSVDFEKDFKEEYGYDIMPYMTDILNRKSLPQAVDYWEFSGRLYQRWWQGNSDLIHSYGLEYTGHSSDTSPYLQTDVIRSSCFTEGRFSDAQRYFDYPGTDQELYAIDGGKHMVKENMYFPRAIWGEELLEPKMTRFADISEDMRAKQAGATAFMYGKKGVMCEMFAASNHGVEPSVLKHIAAFQIMQGVTFVVMSEYMFKRLGEVKYFAPPDYADYSTLKYSMDVINEEIASLTYMTQTGKSVYPIALIDPTEYVWTGDYDRRPYFDAFTKLNRMPQGFTVCDTRKLIDNDYGFKVAVYAGISLPDDIKAKIQAKGIKVLAYEEMDKIGEFVKTDVRYEGEGTPHFLRKVIDGEEFTFIANIESETPIKGKIYAYGREKELCLFPGDVRYISATYDDIPNAETEGEFVCELPLSAPVSFEKPNVIQMEYFKSGDKTVMKTENDREINFNFTAKEPLRGLKLYIPENSRDIVEKVAFNGRELTEITDGRVYDEQYSVYALPALSCGKNTITITKNGKFKYYDRILLEGDFDAFIETDKTYYKKPIEIYNIAIYIPERAKITLSKRTAVLKTDKSVAFQGQPFYSGGITYSFRQTVKESGKYRLKFPLIRDAAYLTVNGKDCGKIVKPPYTFEFDLKVGENDILITVYNTLANEMECYLEPGGIVSKGVLEKI